MEGKNKLTNLATPLGKMYKLYEIEGIRELLKDTESGMYSSKNEDDERVIVMREVGCGLDVLTFQNNGWLRVNYFTEEGYNDGETFQGRWDTN